MLMLFVCGIDRVSSPLTTEEDWELDYNIHFLHLFHKNHIVDK